MEEKFWRLTIKVPQHLKRRYRAVVAQKDLQIQEFGLQVIEAAIEAAEQELAQQEQQAA